MRNFGLIQPGSGARAYRPKIKDRDAVIIAIAAFGAAAVAFSIYALAFGFSAEREVSGFLSFLP